ncbi:MAG TPA: D-ribose pyranase, partial [Pseudomonas sp.]|nr:D-ribose pyranase [Pseudomonas sp.]
EIQTVAPPAFAEIERLKGTLGEREYMPHEAFKLLSRKARAMVRTGECQPYSNIAMVSGVTF